MLSHFGLKCLFTCFIFQAPEYWDILWSKDRAQHCLWFTEDPVRYHTRHLPAQGLCYYHSKKHLKEAGKRYSEIQEYMVPAPKNSFIVGFAAAKDFSIHKPCAWLSPAENYIISVIILQKIYQHTVLTPCPSAIFKSCL